MTKLLRSLLLVVVLVTIGFAGLGCDASDTLRDVADELDDLAHDIDRDHDRSIGDWWDDLWD